LLVLPNQEPWREGHFREWTPFNSATSTIVYWSI
jgi:hypothetical protein